MKMKLSKKILFIIGVFVAMTLTGCGEKLVEMTPSEQNAIVSYSAHTVTLFNTNQKKGYVQLSEENLKELEEAKANVKPDVEGIQEVPTVDNPSIGQESEALTATQAIGLADLEVNYLDMELSNDFSGGNGAYQVAPDAGYKLLTIKFQVENKADTPLAVNILQQNTMLAIKINETKMVSSMITILPMDMGTLVTTLEIGEKQEVYLFFQVLNQTQEEIKIIDLIVQRDGKNYRVKLK